MTLQDRANAELRGAASGAEVEKLYAPIRSAREPGGDDFEAILTTVYQGLLGSRSVAVDGGAHRGVHTVPMARCLPAGTVHAFEPLAQLAEHIRVRASDEGLMSSVEIHRMALGASAGEMRFYHYEEVPALSGATVRSDLDLAEPTEIRVPVMTLDSLELKRLDFMKLDLEGSEFAALQGALQTISRTRPVIVFECDRSVAAERMGFAAAEFFELWEGLGYGVWDIFGTRLTPELWDYSVWMPWYFVALPLDEVHLQGRVAELLAAGIDRTGLSGPEGALNPFASTAGTGQATPLTIDSKLVNEKLISALAARYGLTESFAEYYLLRSFPQDPLQQIDSLDRLIDESRAGRQSHFALGSVGRGRSRSKRWLETLPVASSRFMHIGCEFGGTLLAMTQAGSEVLGFEPQTPTYHFARRLLSETDSTSPPVYSDVHDLARVEDASVDLILFTLSTRDVETLTVAIKHAFRALSERGVFEMEVQTPHWSAILEGEDPSLSVLPIRLQPIYAEEAGLSDSFRLIALRQTLDRLAAARNLRGEWVPMQRTGTLDDVTILGAIEKWIRDTKPRLSPWLADLTEARLRTLLDPPSARDRASRELARTRGEVSRWRFLASGPKA